MLAAVSTSVTILLVVAAGYLVGTIPVANVVARRAGVRDLRSVGDRNPGFWNARTQLGDRAAVPVFVGDVLKGLVAAATGALAAAPGQWWLAYLGGGAAMVGHAWPAFAEFRGGRSVLTFVGAAAVCAPVPAALAIVVTGVVWAWRGLAWGARAGVAAFPVLQLVIEGPYRTAATGALMTFIGLRFAQAALASRAA